MKEKNKGGAKIGNQNSKQWTPEKAQEAINKIYDFARDNDKCRSLTKACVEVGFYEDVVYYLETIYPNGEVDFRPIKKTMSIIKARLMEQALDGDAHATMAIFILKNNHGMADKVDQTNEVTIKEFNIGDVVKFKK